MLQDWCKQIIKKRPPSFSLTHNTLYFSFVERLTCVISQLWSLVCVTHLGYLDNKGNTVFLLKICHWILNKSYLPVLSRIPSPWPDKDTASNLITTVGLKNNNNKQTEICKVLHCVFVLPFTLSDLTVGTKFKLQHYIWSSGKPLASHWLLFGVVCLGDSMMKWQLILPKIKIIKIIKLSK